MKKKVLALFLSAALCVTVLPATGMAAEFGSGDAEITENAGDSQELFEGFFPAATTIPSFETSFDPDGRVFTLRLYNTCLESGAPGSPLNEHLELMNYPGDLYPYSFPAGSLGRDGHFLRDVTIAEDGEDVVVTAVLTERAYRFTVETSNLGFDNIPSFRIVFREKNLDLDGRD